MENYLIKMCEVSVVGWKGKILEFLSWYIGSWILFLL